MPETHATVTLLAHTPDPLSLIYAAFRQCYHAGSVADMWPRLLNGDIPREKQAEFVSRILESGHVSPVEHVSFTFVLDGVSRALTHQLVRHRIASYSQQSQRYVAAQDFDYIVPPRVADNPEALRLFTDCMATIGKTYAELKRLREQERWARIALDEAMKPLTVPQREVLKLYYFEGVSVSQIAELLDYSIWWVKTAKRTGLEEVSRFFENFLEKFQKKC